MDITKTITVKISKEELSDLIKDHLKNKGYNIKSVHFNVDAKEDPDDWRSQYPPDHVFTHVVCTGEEIRLPMK